MKKYILLTAALVLGFQSSSAIAACGYGEIGYLYVMASCIQDDRSNPENVCEVPEGTEIRTVAFFSNVIADDGSNDRYPHSHFFNRLKVQENVTLSGSDSFCYETRAKAEDALDDQLGRYSGREYKRVQVHLRDT